MQGVIHYSVFRPLRSKPSRTSKRHMSCSGIPIAKQAKPHLRQAKIWCRLHVGEIRLHMHAITPYKATPITR